ncbi:MAG TPA: hypothetical protein VG477_04540 [Thermoanaerobaculia bacterium]|nr:hypothetical protein [Thermoanaerobaculia bacterium]
MRTGRNPLVTMAWLQGIYFFVTGVWPILHIASFVAVTGPKVDLWLVKTVGALIAVIGATLMLGARRRTVGAELAFLAVASAASLGIVDAVYALSDRIWDVYLLDAVAEAGLIVLWVIAWRRA